jgi:hypothetical protein
VKEGPSQKHPFVFQDKSQQTDGSGPALFNLFNKRVKENLHIIFAMSPLSPEFGAFIASKNIFQLYTQNRLSMCILRPYFYSGWKRAGSFSMLFPYTLCLAVNEID